MSPYLFRKLNKFLLLSTIVFIAKYEPFQVPMGKITVTFVS